MWFKKAISEIISISLFILITSISLLLLYTFILPSLNDLLVSTPTSLTLINEDFTAIDEKNSLLSLQFGRGVDEEKLEGVQFIFTLGGNSRSYNYYKEPETNSRDVISFDFSEYEGDFENVKIAPIYPENKMGEVIGILSVNDLKKKDLSNSNSDFIIISDPENRGKLVITSYWQEGKNEESASPVHGADVLVIRKNGKENFSGKTDLNGKIEFLLPPGDYCFEQGYNNEAWNYLTSECNIQIGKDEIAEMIIRRNEPILYSLFLEGDSVENVLKDSENNIQIKIKNLNEHSRSIKGEILIDRDKIEEYDKKIEISETLLDSLEIFEFNEDFIPEDLGEYNLQAFIYSNSTGKWALTDHWEWNHFVNVV